MAIFNSYVSLPEGKSLLKHYSNHQPRGILNSYWSPLPSGKRLHNYRKSPFWIGKSTINGVFSIAMLNYQRVYQMMSPLSYHFCCLGDDFTTFTTPNDDGFVWKQASKIHPLMYHVSSKAMFGSYVSSFLFPYLSPFPLLVTNFFIYHHPCFSS